MFRENKAREAVSYLLKKLGGKAEYFKLTKLLYFADRLAIERKGRTITGDAMFALPHGPILSITLDRLNGSHKDFSDIVSNEGRYEIKLIREEPPNALAFSDISILDEVLSKYGNLTWWELREESHKLAEWKKYDRGEETWSRITLEDVAGALGKTESEIRSIAEHQEEMDDVFAFMSTVGRNPIESV